MRPTASQFFSLPYDPVREKAFFERIMLRNGTVKTTTANRLDDVNNLVLPYLSAISERPLKILDAAASSGISTQEWFDHLQRHGIDASVNGTDLAIKAFHVRVGNWLEGLTDAKMRPIHLGIFGRGVPTRGSKLQAVPIAIMSTIVQISRRLGTKTVPVDLVSRKVDLSKISMTEEDILTPGPERFHVIRAANILNLSYFDPITIAAMLFSLKTRLLPSGLLIVCRTFAAENHGTIFRKTGDSLSILARIGKGSEVESIASCL
jgi:hypothetical protein